MIKGLFVGALLYLASIGFIGTAHAYAIATLGGETQTFVLCNGDYVDVATLTNTKIDFIYEINPIVWMGIVINATDMITGDKYTCDLSTSIIL